MTDPTGPTDPSVATCLVCDDPLDDESPSPDYCCQDCQDVWWAEHTEPVEPAVRLHNVIGREIARHWRIAGPWEAAFTLTALAVDLALIIATPTLAVVVAL